MRRSLSTFAVLLLLGGPCLAQQMKQFSLYQDVPYMFNPASTGWHDELELRTGFRKQWVGVQGSPMSTYITVSSILRKRSGGSNPSLRIGSFNLLAKAHDRSGSRVKHALGGYLLVDQYGVFWMNAAMVNYAFHFPISREYSLSFGASAGVNNDVFRANDVSLLNPNDPNFNAFVAAGTTEYFFDMNFGTWFYSDRMFVGFAINQLIQTHAFLTQIKSDFRLRHHHYVTAGYTFDLHPDWTATPSIMLKGVRGAPISWEVGSRFDYKKFMWAGLAYRHLASVVLMYGLHINGRIDIGYSYDLPISGLTQFYRGGHELGLGIKFKNDNKKR